MKMTTTLKSAIVAASALAITAIAAPASAGVVTFQTSGTWSNVVGGTNVSNTTGSGSNAGDANLSWGRYSDKSAFQFDAKNAGSFNLNNGGATSFFTLADFKHVNEQISGNGITSAKLNFQTKIFVDNVLAATRTYTWNFGLEETADYSYSGWCDYGTANGGCNDKVTVAGSGNFGNTFQVGNDLYTLDLSGFQMLNQYNQYVNTNSFITKEDTTNVGYIRGKLSMTTLTSAVPEPATWAMMLIGFFGAGSALRSTRRRELMAVAA